MHTLIVILAVSFVAWGQTIPLRQLDDLVRAQNFEARRASSSDPKPEGNADWRPIGPGETLVLTDLEGPGIITHIWITVGSADPFYGRSLALRIYWDGSEKPSVESPLGDFFGVGHGAHAPFTSMPVVVSSQGRARSCFWRMPFRKRARITVSNESTRYKTDLFYYYVDWRKYAELPADTLYFHARYAQSMPAAPGEYTMLETTGRGHYAGTVYSVQHVATGWFGEGDDRFYIDGESKPSLEGTGTEDYFGDAWGFREFSTPYFGVSLWEGFAPGDRGTAYRWHVEDPIPFRKSLKVAIEHKGSIFTGDMKMKGTFLHRPDWLSSVAFWYQTPAVSAKEPLPAAEKRIAPYRVLGVRELTIRAAPETGLAKAPGGFNYAPAVADARVEVDFSVAQDGLYQLEAVLSRSLLGGRYQPFLDGKPLGAELDLGVPGQDTVAINFDVHDLKAGSHMLRFEGRGASASQRTMIRPAYAFGLNYLLLLRLQDLTGYK